MHRLPLLLIILLAPTLPACEEPTTMTITPEIKTDGSACAEYLGRDFVVRRGDVVFDRGEVNRLSHEANAVCVASFSATGPAGGSFVVEVEGMVPVTSSRSSLAEDLGELVLLDVSSERLDLLGGGANHKSRLGTPAT